MIRDHDKIVYLNKKTYLHKPKFAWKFLFNLIKKNMNGDLIIFKNII